MSKKKTKSAQNPETEKSAPQTRTKNVVTMPLINPHAAGIDIGDKEHVVAVPEGRAENRVRKFGSMTCNLLEIIEWLKQCAIQTIAMESTGVYWKPLFSMLIKEGFEVYLVNAAHVKNVTGRKTDEDDAMWIQKLHSCGILKSSFLPGAMQAALQTLVRHRKTLTEDRSRFINRMQKALELMNIKIHTVISDITGQTGLAIIEAILKGERDAANFLPLVGKRIKAQHETIRQSMEGNWNEEQLFVLKEHYEMFKHYEAHIATCDKEIEIQLAKYAAWCNDGETQEPKNRQEAAAAAKTKKKKEKNHPQFNVRDYLESIYGVDVLNIFGLNEMGGLMLLAEMGTDLSKWETVKHFISWLNLCPNNKISGGKLISSKLMRKKSNTASQAFRHAANGVQKSNNWLGDYFRRMKSKGGHKYAIIATANKIAAIFYLMVTRKEEFKPVVLEEYQEKYKKAKIAYFERKLAELKEEAA